MSFEKESIYNLIQDNTYNRVVTHDKDDLHVTLTFNEKKDYTTVPYTLLSMTAGLILLKIGEYYYNYY